VRVYPFFIPHAGCPHRCLFCQQQRTSGQAAAPSPEEVGRGLEELLPSTGSGEVAFYGGTFTLLPEPLQRAYLERVGHFVHTGRISGIRVSTRPDALGERAVKFLAGMGVTTVEMGCQSFSAEVLNRSGRGHGAQEAEGAVERLRRIGLGVGLQLMPGLPGGDREEAKLSLERALSLRPDFLRIYPSVVLKNTPLENLYLSGDYRPLSLETAVDWCAELLWRCRRAGVAVIRMGLQGTPELDRGEGWVAGPYHPAFGQLVRSFLWLRAMEKGMEKVGLGAVEVNPADRADALGHRRENIVFLQRRFGNLAIIANPAVSREHLSFGGRIFPLAELAAY
jgi:histone acetyltransferase (RNA polymerase elongator complex component)